MTIKYFLINNELGKQIREKSRKISTKDVRFVDMVLDLFRLSLVQEENIHSCEIENPEKFPYDNEELERCKSNLGRAWVWSVNHFNSDISEDFIKVLNAKILGSGKSEYRRINVRPSGSPRTPPYPAKIPLEMERLRKELDSFDELERQGITDPLEKALFLHYNLTRIHPFEDGNGRTARTLQNLVLFKNCSLPVSIIYGGERPDYLRHLREADDGYA
jgi:Fic family protein